MERVNLSIMTFDEIVAREKDGCDTLIVDWAKQVIFTGKKATDELQPVGEELIGKEGTLICVRVRANMEAEKLGLVDCPSCHGSGQVNSHNPKCWDCDGRGRVTPDRCEAISEEEWRMEQLMPPARTWDYQ